MGASHGDFIWPTFNDSLDNIIEVAPESYLKCDPKKRTLAPCS